MRTPRPRRDERIFRIALVVSVALHALLFATINFRLHIVRQQPRAPLRAFRVDDAMRAYDIVPVTVGFGEPEPEPLPIRRPLPVPLPPDRDLRAPVTSGEAVAAPPAAGDARPGLSAAERLSSGFRDPQLLAPVDRLPPDELTEAEWLRLRLANQLGIYNDSLVAEAEAKLRATDWTAKDKNGGRWGVSPGQIHLGKLTLPLPFGFSPGPGRREEIAGQMRSWQESQGQAARVEASQTFEQRVKAIRDRQQAARDSARKAGGK